MYRAVIWGLVLGLGVAGCSGKKSSLMLERRARGPIAEEPRIAKAAEWQLDPSTQTLAKNDIEVNVNFASHNYLKNFFASKELFGNYAGNTPYYPEHMVFYLTVMNRSDQKVLINPQDFVLVDDRGNQLGTVGVDYVTAFHDVKRPVATTTREMLGSASPGYLGFSLPIGKMFSRCCSSHRCRQAICIPA
jgi:hypothetical protein